MQTARSSFDLDAAAPDRVDVSVEFAHVYTDETFGPEHRQAAEEAVRIKRRLGAPGQSVSLALLVDDYNPTTHVLDVPAFVEALAKLGARPDHVVYESWLAQPAMLLLARLHGRERDSLRRYVETKGKVPCSLLLATWHLLRLGVNELAPAPLHLTTQGSHPFVGTKTLTVLPQRFAPVEERAMEILEASPYRDVTPRIEHAFLSEPWSRDETGSD